ncbi:MAG TPA: alpha/beta hydrolase [Phycisphaerae bacterium]|nr:alpha/beta hydrolase [Phycisphaerae bacterium]
MARQEGTILHTIKNDSSMPVETDSSPGGKPRGARRAVVRLLVSLTVAYLGWCAVLFFWQDEMLFPRYSAPSPSSPPPSANVQIVRIDVGEKRHMEGWFFPAASASLSSPAPVVIYCHGNAEIIDQQEWFVENYHRLGCSVFLPEYRGYGRSPGKPSEKAIVEDCVRFHDELLKREDVDPGRIAIHGRSLGGGVAAQIAARRKPAALILESTFTSVASYAQKYCVPKLLVRHPFRTDLVLPELDVPVLVFHGTRDDIVPVKHGRRLAKLARNAVYVEYDCGHNDAPGPGNEADYWGRIEAFLEEAGITRPTAAQAVD